jgi:hypothetical protein
MHGTVNIKLKFVSKGLEEKARLGENVLGSIILKLFFKK